MSEVLWPLGIVIFIVAIIGLPYVFPPILIVYFIGGIGGFIWACRPDCLCDLPETDYFSKRQR